MDQELSQMIGSTGTQVPGLGVIVFRDGKEVYSNFQGQAVIDVQQPITARMLASHTSSLRDDKIYSIPPDMSLQEFFQPTGKFYVNGGHFAPKGEEPRKFFKYCSRKIFL